MDSTAFVTAIGTLRDVATFQWGQERRTGYRGRLACGDVTLPVSSLYRELRPGPVIITGRLTVFRGTVEISVDAVVAAPVPAPPEDEPPF